MLGDGRWASCDARGIFEQGLQLAAHLLCSLELFGQLQLQVLDFVQNVQADLCAHVVQGEWRVGGRAGGGRRGQSEQRGVQCPASFVVTPRSKKKEELLHFAFKCRRGFFWGTFRAGQYLRKVEL